MSALRILWLCWCAAWAAVWSSLAAGNVPHRACVEPMLVVTNGQSCAAWATQGSAGLVAVFILAAVLSVAAMAARMRSGKAGA